MKQYLLDTSVVLDLFLNRLPWAADMAVIWDAHRQGQIKALVAAFALPTIFYIVRRQAGLTTAQSVVQACLSTLDITPHRPGNFACRPSTFRPRFRGRSSDRLCRSGRRRCNRDPRSARLRGIADSNFCASRFGRFAFRTTRALVGRVEWRIHLRVTVSFMALLPTANTTPSTIPPKRCAGPAVAASCVKRPTARADGSLK
jgi:hypothetical protein